MNELKNKIYTIKNKQVMLDSDLAELYQIPTKRLNEAVKRNKERFPEEFMFQLTPEEYHILINKFKRSQFVTSTTESLKPLNNQFSENKTFQTTPLNKSLRSQFATLEKGKGKHKKYLPYVFTEQGVAMLSAILKSKKAIYVSIQIINAFVKMRHFLQINEDFLSKLSNLETKQIEFQIKTDDKFEQVFNLIQEKNIKPEKGIFFDGQIFQAHKFISDLISEAKEEIILIDNFVDENTLILFSQTKLKVTIYTKNITEKLKLALKKYNQQYNNLEIKQFDKSHDRFLIINKEIYHIGASLKDLGKKWFAFSKFEDKEILTKLN